jgi:hypothetical protein
MTGTRGWKIPASWKAGHDRNTHSVGVVTRSLHIKRARGRPGYSWSLPVVAGPRMTTNDMNGFT